MTKPGIKTILWRAVRVAGCFCLWVVPPVFLLISLIMVRWMSTYSYESILHWYTVTWPDAFNAEDISAKFFTRAWYANVRLYQWVWLVAILGVMVGYGGMSVRIWRGLQRFWMDGESIGRFMINTYTGLTLKEKAVLLSLFGGLLVYRLYFYFAFPLQTDEIFSYQFFIRQGLFLSVASYPSTNNHLFFSLTEALLYKLHFLSAKALLRWPNILLNLLLCYTIFCVARYWSDFRRAILLVAGTAFCYMLSYYAVIGRGYEYQTICVVAGCLGCQVYFLSDKGGASASKKGYGLFILSSIIGCYCNPLFVYPLGTLILACSYGLVKRKDYGSLLVFFRAIGIICGVTLILYTPIILGNGWQNLTNGQFVAGYKSWGQLWENYPFFVNDLKFLTGYGVAGIITLIVAILFLMGLCAAGWLRGPFYNRATVYFWASVGSLVSVTLYQRVYPIERSLCWWQLALNLFFVNACYDCFLRWFPRAGGSIFIVFLIVKLAGNGKGLYWSRFSVENNAQVKVYRQVERDFKALEVLGPSTWQVMDSDDFYPLFIRYMVQQRAMGDRVVFGRGAAWGDILLVPDGWAELTHPTGYIRWGGKRPTANGDWLTIYVSDRLISKGGRGPGAF